MTAAPDRVLAAVRSIPHPRQEPTMTAPRPSPAGLSPLLDQLEQAHAAIGDSPAFRVLGYVQDDEDPEQVLARFYDGGTSVFAECYGADAARLIVAAVNALPQLTAAIRAVEALHVPSHSYCVVCDVERDVEVVGNNPRCEHRTSFCRACEVAWPCPTVRALTAALTPGADTAGATA